MVVVDVSFLRWWSSVQKATVQTGWSWNKSKQTWTSLSNGDRPCFPRAFLLISWNKSKQTWLKALWEAADKDSSNSRWTKNELFQTWLISQSENLLPPKKGSFQAVYFKSCFFSPSLTIFFLGFLTHWMQSCSWPRISWRRVVTPLGGPPDSTDRSPWTFRPLSVPVAGIEWTNNTSDQKKSHIYSFYIILHIILRTLNLPHFHRGSFSNDFMVSWGAPSDQLLFSTRKTRQTGQTRQTTCGADRCVAQWTARLAPVAAFGVGNHNHPWVICLCWLPEVNQQTWFKQHKYRGMMGIEYDRVGYR